MAGANVAVMIWVWILAVLIVVLVGAAVLPRRGSHPREDFPWFWLMQARSAAAWILPVLSLAAVGLSVWGWKRGRV